MDRIILNLTNGILTISGKDGMEVIEFNPEKPPKYVRLIISAINAWSEKEESNENTSY
jgi:hypothetical protein